VLVEAIERGHARERAYRRACAATWAPTRAAAGTTSTGQAAWRRISSSRHAGDVTTFPLKQGGLATQQADAAAEAMLAALGVPIVPRPFDPVLNGVLYTDREPAYLRASLDGRGSEPRPYAMWWPPSKIAGRHLAPYLAIRSGAPRAPEVRREHDAIPVTVDIPRAVHAVSDALDASATPSTRAPCRRVDPSTYGSRCGEATDGEGGGRA
jgi:hypothetical protein